MLLPICVWESTQCAARLAGRGGNPTDGKVYVFVGKTRKVMKLLHWERGGYYFNNEKYLSKTSNEMISSRLESLNCSTYSWAWSIIA